MLPVTVVVVIVTPAKSPRVLATNRGKTIDWRDALTRSIDDQKARVNLKDEKKLCISLISLIRLEATYCLAETFGRLVIVDWARLRNLELCLGKTKVLRLRL